jgi:hypothetical protein
LGSPGALQHILLLTRAYRVRALFCMLAAAYCLPVLLLVLQADFRYQPVLAHKSATSIHRTHSNASTYLEVFNVTGYQGSEWLAGASGYTTHGANAS